MNAKTAEIQGLKKRGRPFQKAVVSPRQSQQNETVITQGYGGRDRTVEILTNPMCEDYWAIICSKIDDMADMLRNKMEFCENFDDMKNIQSQIKNLRSFKDLPNLILEDRKALEDEEKKKSSSRA